MTRDELLAALRAIADRSSPIFTGGDPEANHGEADQLLIDFINDPDVTAAYGAIDKWYA